MQPLGCRRLPIGTRGRTTHPPRLGANGLCIRLLAANRFFLFSCSASPSRLSAGPRPRALNPLGRRPGYKCRCSVCERCQNFGVVTVVARANVSHSATITMRVLLGLLLCAGMVAHVAAECCFWKPDYGCCGAKPGHAMFSVVIARGPATRNANLPLRYDVVSRFQQQWPAL